MHKRENSFSCPIFLGIIFSSSCHNNHTKIVPLSFNFSLLKCALYNSELAYYLRGKVCTCGFIVCGFLLRAGESEQHPVHVWKSRMRSEQTCAAFVRSPVYIKRCRARPLIIILYTLLCQRWCCSVIPSTFSLWALLQLRLTFSQLKLTQKTHSLTRGFNTWWNFPRNRFMKC